MAIPFVVVCQRCGYEWTPIDKSSAKQIKTAAKVNGAGPFCGLCLHVEQARRHATLRGITLDIDWPLRRDGGES